MDYMDAVLPLKWRRWQDSVYIGGEEDDSAVCELEEKKKKA